MDPIQSCSGRPGRLLIPDDQHSPPAGNEYRLTADNWLTPPMSPDGEHADDNEPALMAQPMVPANDRHTDQLQSESDDEIDVGQEYFPAFVDDDNMDVAANMALQSDGEDSDHDSNVPVPPPERCMNIPNPFHYSDISLDDESETEISSEEAYEDEMYEEEMYEEEMYEEDMYEEEMYEEELYEEEMYEEEMYEEEMYEDEMYEEEEYINSDMDTDEDLFEEIDLQNDYYEEEYIQEVPIVVELFMQNPANDLPMFPPVYCSIRLACRRRRRVAVGWPFNNWPLNHQQINHWQVIGQPFYFERENELHVYVEPVLPAVVEEPVDFVVVPVLAEPVLPALFEEPTDPVAVPVPAEPVLLAVVEEPVDPIAVPVSADPVLPVVVMDASDSVAVPAPVTAQVAPPVLEAEVMRCNQRQHHEHASMNNDAEEGPWRGWEVQSHPFTCLCHRSLNHQQPPAPPPPGSAVTHGPRHQPGGASVFAPPPPPPPPPPPAATPRELPLTQDTDLEWAIQYLRENAPLPSQLPHHRTLEHRRMYDIIIDSLSPRRTPEEESRIEPDPPESTKPTDLRQA